MIELLITECFADLSWKIISTVADELKPEALPKPVRRPAPFSFFRSVSKEVYDRQNSQYVLRG